MARGRTLRRFLPILDWLPAYRRSWLGPDVIAALSVWALLVPQSLAYASVARVPVQFGLYTAFAGLIAYAVFGTSRQVIQGPSAGVAAVSAAVILPFVGAAAMDTDTAARYAAGFAIVVAVVYIALGLLRMGWVSTFLSKAVLGGFVFGLAIGITIDQSHKLLGVAGPSGSYVQELVKTITEIPDTSLTTLAVGVASLGALLLLRRFVPRWPRALIIMALAIIAVRLFELAAHGVAVTGQLPTGLFSVGLPHVGWDHRGAFAVGALSVIFVGYAESLASARMTAAKHHYRIAPDQELVAQGAACGASSLVGGFVNAGSLSKTSVADNAGQRTQLASLINAGLILLTMVFLTGLFKNLPSATLGAVVIDSMVGLMSVAEMKRYRRVDRPSWIFFLGAMAGVLFFGITQGVLIGVVLSLLLLIYRASRPALRRMVRDPASQAYVNSGIRPDLPPTPGILVVRIDGPLFFADADRFHDSVVEMIDEADPPVRRLILDMAAVSQSDVDAADSLTELAGEMRERGVEVALARVHGDILALWRRAGTLDVIGEDQTFPTVREAVGSQR